MTLGSVSTTGSSAEGCFCSYCGAKMMRYFSDNGVVSQNQINQLISESFLTVKGAAVFLPRGNGSSPSSAPGISQRWNKHTGDLQQHLQTMFTVLRPEDNIRLAVRLESAFAQPHCTRYMVVVSTNGRQDTEESVVLGMDFGSSDSSCTVGLVLPLWSDTLIHLDGDGGFSVSTVNRVHVFKPVSVQAMWSALQSLHKACEVARCHNYYPGSLFLTWVSYYQSQVSSDQVCINEWNVMQDVQSHRADSPVLFTDVPTERERTERLIKTRLREIMMQKDLENVTSKEIRTELEMQMVCNLREFKEFIDNEMIVILGQMDSPTEIFDHVYLGSEWNASNLEELQNSGVRYILNVTREIDNFFPGMFEYHNIRVYDEEATNLLEYWNDTYKFITKAKKAGAKCLVHCKMGVSRSASTVIAYAMKEYGWDLEKAFDYVKERRTVTKPNPSFMKQLEEYQGILLASKQRHNKLWRSHSDSDLSERHESLLCKTGPHSHTLGLSDPHNNNNGPSPSLQHFLLQALGAANDPDNKTSGSHISDTHSEPVRLTRSHSHSPGPSASNGLCDSRENRQDPFLPPRAAKVVPEERMDNSALVVVAVTVPITAIQHPPPSLHIILPSPFPQPLAKSLHLGLSTQLSSLVPKQKAQCVELTLDLPDLSSSEVVSQAILESSDDSDTLGRSLSDPLSERGDSVSMASPGIPMAVSPLTPTTALSLGPYANDDNNNPSGGANPVDTTCVTASSNLSTDSIDFFSAREKFLGLSQDGRTLILSEQTAQRTPQSRCPIQELQPLSPENPAGALPALPGTEEEEQGKNSPHTEDGSNRSSHDKASLPPHHDNGVSVRHIVTEIESISHPPAAPSLSSTQPASRSPQQLLPEDRAEDTPLTSPSYPQSPSTPPSDWPAGSVRRATKQLEQRLRQELDLPLSNTSTQRSPLHSPSAEFHPTHSPLHTTSTDCPSLLAPTTDCLEQHRPTPAPEQGRTLNETFTVSAELNGDLELTRETEQEGFVVSDMDIAPAPAPSFSHYPDARHTPEPIPIIVCPSLEPSRAEPQASPSPALLWLEGVTALDSDTDGPSPPPPHHRRLALARSSEELEKIQETLRELQAFLYEAGGLGLGAGERPGQGQHHRKTPVWQRAMEIEARIRQAGLTPPSLMKRSASLAKLDCLELSASDLSDWDIRPTTASPHGPPLVPTPHPRSPHHPSPDDVSKKQRVLCRSPPPTHRAPLGGVYPLDPDRTGRGSQSAGSDPPSPSSPPFLVLQGEEELETDLSPQLTRRTLSPKSAPDVTMTTAQQQPRGKSHPLRRLRKAADKKRTAPVLYNTM
ncbi:protein phosphatase Slingshot homolog 2-like isoform X1 [Coregonus clupeaformis]|uniref:protein phosphatase Slingshot homolog 2-like isoform X1 n=1 Tax=Coregonus clupeaformis TaxID=59861 RepID=UPI001E1C6FF3|nr:protein phosphatase Slingshot homolog 2-like isoform X1 [Coregonus clupeaformis]